AGKLSLNSANYEQLMRLPGMTDDVAGALIDWRDPDDIASASGAESEAYLALAEPYYAKNAPFETVEEALLVRGVTRPMLYGNGTAPPLGSAQTSVLTSSSGSLLTDVQLARGWYDLLTVYSAEPNTTADGQP